MSILFDSKLKKSSRSITQLQNDLCLSAGIIVDGPV